MNAKEFFDTVVDMRHNQRRYFQTRSNIFFTESKRLEKVIDEEIQRVSGIQSIPTTTERLPSLFDPQ